MSLPIAIPLPDLQPIPPGFANYPAGQRVDMVCDAFEAEWAAGRPPVLEEFLSHVGDDARADLLYELLVVDLDYRVRLGHPAVKGEYLRRFRADANVVMAAFARREQFSQQDTQPVDREDSVASGKQSPARSKLTSTAAPGERFGDYQLLAEIARGGMGVVYQARHVKLNRVVALKTILDSFLANEQGVARFFAEAEAAAQLEHPGIVPIYEIGEQQGRHFYAMAYIEGESLSAKVARGPLEPRLAAKLLSKIARAVAFAHSRGVIHRDLKPGNVLVDAAGEPRVTDFGLAKRVESGSELTTTGQILGTPAYMPPEQAAGRMDEVGPLADVYSLGALLYCLLTGRPPFQAATAVQTLKHVLEREPVSPRQLNPAVDRDLETICLKCLEKSPPRRYASAAELADELDRFLLGAPIQARPATSIERAVKWAKRRPTVAALTGVSALAAVLLAALFVGLYFQGQLEEEKAEADRQRDLASAAKDDADKQRAAAETARDEISAQKTEVERQKSQVEDQKAEVERQKGLVEVERDRVRRVLYAADMNLADRAWHESRIRQMVDILNKHIPQGGAADQRGFEWYYLNRLANSERLAYYGHNSGITGLGIAPAAGLAATGSGPVTVWEIETGRTRLTIPREKVGGFAFGLAMSADGKRLAVGCQDRKLLLWDVEANREICNVVASNDMRTTVVAAVVLSPDGRLTATDSGDNQITIRDDTGQAVQVLRGHTDGVNGLAFDADGKRLASASSDKTVRVWSVETGECLAELTGFGNSASCVAWSPDGLSVAAGAYDETIRVWNLADKQQTHLFRGHRGTPSSLAFHPQGRRLASGGTDASVRVWNLDTSASPAEPQLFRGHSYHVYGIGWAADGRHLVSASQEGSARVWDTAATPESTVVQGHTAKVTDVAMSPDGKHFASVSWDGQVLLRDLVAGRIVKQHDSGARYLAAVAFHPDGQTIAFAGGDPIARLWNTATDDVRSFAGHANNIEDLAFDAAGDRLITASDDHTARIWDVAGGTTQRTLAGHQNTIYNLAVDPAGELLATGGHDSQLILWDLSSGDKRWTANILNFPSGLTFSPDGKLVATPARNGLGVDLFNVQDGTLAQTIRGHTDKLQAIAFSADSRRMATGSWDKTVKLWDVATGQETLTLPAGEQVQSLAWSRDGRRIVAGCDTKTILWYAPVPDRLAHSGDEHP